MIRTILLITLLAMLGCSTHARAEPAARPNVLFLIVDDMADWAGCLDGHPDVRTPTMDRLARRGVLFTNAHCVSPICGPSRASVLTGLRPETSGVYHNKGTYIDYVPDAVSMQKHFMQHGYTALGAGKVNHGLGMRIESDWNEYGPDCGVLGTPFIGEELHVKSMDPTITINRGRLKVTLPMNGGLSAIDRPTMTWDSFDWGPLDVGDDDFPDGKIARWGCEQLQRKFDMPFFLAVGLYKPHQPFFAPRKYFDMYDAAKVKLPPTIAGDLVDVPRPGRDLATHPWSSGTHKTVVKYNKWREAVHAYLATITFADAQIGRVVDALDASAYANNTWIVLWSDHGWNLGQKEHWGKHAPWRDSLKVPMIIIPPKNQKVAGFTPGTRCDAPVSLLDLYPTLSAGCGLKPRKELEGKNLLPLLGNPQAKWDEAFTATIGRGNNSVFNGDWRYIRYFDGSEELYDLNADPQEWFNLAGDTDKAKIKAKLARHIPEDKRIAQFVRLGQWKYVRKTDGTEMLFDIDQTFGISEHFDVAAENPEVLTQIRTYLKENNVKARRVNIPTEDDE